MTCTRANNMMGLQLRMGLCSKYCKMSGLELLSRDLTYILDACNREENVVKIRDRNSRQREDISGHML